MATATSTPRPRTLHPAVRAVLSVLLAVHLLGVFIAPLNQRPDRSSSPLTETITSWLLPYLDTAYLNHGYGFFSPDPGSSFVIRYELEMEDGTTQRGVLPDRDQHWPRLRYHRHFMLSSQARMFDDLLPRSYAVHLRRTHGAKRAVLEFVEHRPSAPDEITEGKRLDNPDTYRVVAVVRADENDETEIELMEEEVPMPGEPPSFGPPTIGPMGAPAAGEAEEVGPLRPSPSRRGPLRPEGPPQRGPLRPETLRPEILRPEAPQ